MKIKTIYDRLKPGFKSSLQKNARQYSSAKRLKYVLMSKTSWYDLTISQVSDISENLQQKNLEDITIILNSESLEKKSKLRSFFEKNKTLVCVPFYPDNDQTISKLTYNYLREKNISISPSNVNLIVNKCGGDRQTIIN